MFLRGDNTGKKAAVWFCVSLCYSLSVVFGKINSMQNRKRCPMFVEFCFSILSFTMQVGRTGLFDKAILSLKWVMLQWTAWPIMIASVARLSDYGYSVLRLPTWISELHLLFETLIFVFSLHFKKMCDEFYLFYTVLIWNIMIGKYSLQNESSFCSPLNSRSNTQSDCQVCILMKCKFDPLHLFKIKTNPLSPYVIVITFRLVFIH